jgi:hypothetical protein
MATKSGGARDENIVNKAHLNPRLRVQAQQSPKHNRQTKVISIGKTG